MENKQTSESTNKVKNDILGFTRINNDIKVVKFKQSNIGTAMFNKFEQLALNHNDSREIVLTNKNNVLALLLDSSDLNIKALEEKTAIETAKAQKEYNEIMA